VNAQSTPQPDGFLDHLLDDLPMPIFLLAEQSLEIMWVNTTAQEWLERGRRTLIGRRLDDFITSAQNLDEGRQRCQEGARVITLRHIVLKTKKTADNVYHLTFFPSGSGIGLMVKPAHIQPNAGVSDGGSIAAMGRMLAHEIKNPLAGINGAAQLLRDDINTDEGQDLIDLIGSEIGRIRRLADRMQSLGDHNPETVEAVNIHEILRRARQIIQSSVSNDITFTENYDPSLPDMAGDADTLMQALLNLIKNASEAILTNGGSGDITLETAYRSGVRRAVNGVTGQQLPIEIRIIDNGSGIPKNLLHDVFRPFVTNKPSGQGLGLALVSKVARAHGGLVEVKSRPGHTVFSLLLPVSKGDII